MKYEINFDKNMAAEFYAELISSVDFRPHSQNAQLV